ncbi:hypothetical protein ACVBEH_32485, partial [Roseateles sp. GG27B]
LDDGPINLDEIWNNDKYLSARSLFSSAEVEKRRPTVCDTCDIFAHHPSKRRPKPQLKVGETIQIHRRS